jgi:hypothetical protein
MQEWNKVKTDYLISLLVENECLWNKKCPDYKNRDLKCDAMCNIGIKLEVASKEVERKIHSLRCQFVREVNKIESSKVSGAGSQGVYVSKWCHFNELKFLKDTNEVRHTKSNLVSTLLFIINCKYICIFKMKRGTILLQVYLP